MQVLQATGKGVTASGHIKPMLVGVRGDEMGNSLLIAGRPGIVLGIRLRVFHRTIDGPYVEKRKKRLQSAG